MSEPFRILVVCLGNVCRSPLAERMLRMRFDEFLGDQASMVDVSSAGVRALAGQPMDDRAADELVRLGGDPSGFVSTQLTEAMVEAAEVVLTASVALRSRVLARAPRALRRTFTIREFAVLATWEGPGPDEDDPVRYAASRRGCVTITGYDVPDPIGRSQQVHQQVAALLDESCTAIARSVARWVSA